MGGSKQEIKIAKGKITRGAKTSRYKPKGAPEKEWILGLRASGGGARRTGKLSRP